MAVTIAATVVSVTATQAVDGVITVVASQQNFGPKCQLMKDAIQGAI